MSSSSEKLNGGTYKLNTGFDIPLVGFGTYKIVGENLKPAIDAALKAKCRLFDTAKYYNNEKELGAALKELLPKYGLSRKDIFITTKMFPDEEDTYNKSTKHVEESLRNLQVDYIDLYLVHYPKPSSTENDDPKNAEYRKITYKVLEEAKHAGKVRSIGVSNYEIYHLEELKIYANIKPAVNQLEYHPHFVRTSLKNYCEENGIFFQAFSSLARHEPKLIEDPTVVAIAKKHGVSVPLILLAWAHCQGVGVLPKSVNPQRIVDNFEVIKIKLSQEDIEALTKLDKGQHYIRCTGWLVK